MNNFEALSRAAGGLTMALVVCGLAAAQDAATYIRLVDEDAGYYHPSAVDKDIFTSLQARNQRKILVGKVCAGSEPLRENQKEFDAWFKRYYYPMMTDPRQLSKLSKLRRELMRDYFNKIKNETAGLQVRDHLNKLSLEFLQKLSTVNSHPAVRYNAMLIIGELDSRAAESTGGVKPAEPMYEAFDVLQAELVSPSQIDAVRVAALLGLQRHAELNRQRPADKQWTDAQTAGLATKVGQIAAAKKPPALRSLEGHTWMRRLALETLTELAATKPMPPVAALVDRIVSDESEPIDLRVAAAKAQGRLKNPLPMGAKSAGAAEKIARVGVAAVWADLELLQHYIEQLEREELTSTSRGGPEGGGGFGGGLGILEGSGDGKPEDVKIVRDPLITSTQRRLKARLENVRLGLVGADGVSGLAAAGDKPAIDKLVAAITGIQKTLDAAPGGDPVALDDLKQFYAELSSKGDALEALLPSAKPAAEPSTPAGPAADGPVSDGPAADGPVSGPPATGPVAEPAGPAP